MIRLAGFSEEDLFKTFPNGETLLVTDKISNDGFANLYRRIVFKYESNADLIKLMILKKYLDEQKNLCRNLVITYMPYSRMDRVEGNSAFTLKYISQFINSLGFERVIVVEPHSDVTCALLDNVKSAYINFDMIGKVKEEVGFIEDEDYIVFPDAGAYKRYSKMNVKNVLFCNKVRDFATGDIKGLDLVGDTSKASGKMAIIVDDLSSYGGTFIHTADRLRQEGFDKIYLLVAHAENVIFKRNDRTGKLLFEHVDKIFTTDSILTEHNNTENAELMKQLKVYNVEDVLFNV